MRFLERFYDLLVLPWVILIKSVFHKNIARQYRAFLRRFGLVLSSTVPQKDLSGILGRNAECLLWNATCRDGNLSLEAQHALASVVKELAPETIFEIGTFNGNTTLQMAVNAPEAKIFTLDLPKEHLQTVATKFDLDREDEKYVGCPEVVFLGTPFEVRIHRLFGDSGRFDFSPYLGTMDLVFVDGSHAYDYVKSDTENAFRMLSPKGVIIWDDYDPGWPDVVRYLSELSREREIIWIRGTSLCVYKELIP